MVSPLWVEKAIQVDGRKQAEIERGARSELLDNLPGSFVFLVGVGPCEVEVELIDGGLGKEFGTVAERFQVEELVFDEAVDGLDVALIGVSGGGDARVLAVAEGSGETGTMAEIVLAPKGPRSRCRFARPDGAVRRRSDPGGAGCGRRTRRWPPRCAGKRRPETTSRCGPRGRCTPPAAVGGAGLE